MRRASLLSLAVRLLALAVLALAAPAAAQPHLASDAAAGGAVRIALILQTDQGRFLHSTGSGFVAAPNLVVTAAHVVAPAREYPNIQITVVAPGGSGPAEAQVIRFSALADLALLRFEGPSPGPLTISMVTPSPGDPVVALGYPDMDDLRSPPAEIVRPTPPSRSAGQIASLRDRAPTGEPIPTINHEAAISSGSSGGPLVDNCGRVIGVNSWHARGGETLSSRGVAIRAAPLIEFLRGAGVSPDLSDEPCVTPLERAEAERDAAVASVAEQNVEIRRRLAEADRLTRFTLVAVVAGGVLFLLSLAMMTVALFGLRRTVAPKGGREVEVGELVVLPTPEEPAPKRRFWPLALVVAAGAIAAGFVLPLAIQVMNSSAAMRRAVGDVDFAGQQVCRFDPQASGVREGADTSFSIDAGGCVNGRTLYAPAERGRALKRVMLSESRGAIEVLTLSTETGEFRREHFPLSNEALIAAIAAARDTPAPDSCSANARTAVAQRNAALQRYAAGRPAERVVWRCHKRQ